MCHVRTFQVREFVVMCENKVGLSGAESDEACLRALIFCVERRYFLFREIFIEACIRCFS